MPHTHRLCTLVLVALAIFGQRVEASLSFIDAQIAAHPGQSGAYVLDTSGEALVARAWLCDHAKRSIEVQYFIWSADNIGILAAEALLRAAQRGVKVRVIVDDLLVDAPDDSLLALSRHPNIDIRVYNPQNSVGVPFHKRLWNIVTNFRGVNQRMHDKTFIVDGKVAITGGRNMAAEYYDYHHRYNFRDRDVLLAGQVVRSIRDSFERFWASELAAQVEQLYGESNSAQESARLSDAEVRRIYDWLRAYAAEPTNFAPEVRRAIQSAPSTFERLARETIWSRVEFISDSPGKNRARAGFGGGGLSTDALKRLVMNARSSIVIQSPYLVVSDKALELFRETIARGVQITISTNSLASTDNLQAFAGYRNQREALLAMGLKIFEYRADAVTQRRAWEHELAGQLLTGQSAPQFGLHAKTMVVDSKVVFIGTFNLDPRSENLNTEVGAIVYDDLLARRVEAAIRVDMRSGNSWNAATDDPDSHVSFVKRNKVRFWQLLPIKPLL
jgi:cardiolipin synthase C